MAVIVIPIDSSKTSEYCLDFYLKFLHREGNKVYTCYVAEYFGDVGVMDGPSPGHVLELEEEDRQKAAKIGAEVTQLFRTNNVDGSFTRLHAKDAWHKIVEYSKSVKATMIVMGSRGLGKIRRTILGSVSESVLHHAEIPVLICKLPGGHQH